MNATKSMYAIKNGLVIGIEPATGDCMSCYQAGEDTTSPVWYNGERAWSIAEGRWVNYGANECCEECRLADNEGIFAFAESIEEAVALASDWDAGIAQPDNMIYETRTVVALFKNSASSPNP
jgi:hypothetical protein